MPIGTRTAWVAWVAWGVVLSLAVSVGCSKKDEIAESVGHPPSASAAAAPSAKPSAAAPSAAPAASASADLPPRADCPKGSAGPGTFDRPCDAKGTARLMEAVWTGKTDDKGPHFRVTNKATATVLYGR